MRITYKMNLLLCLSLCVTSLSARTFYYGAGLGLGQNNTRILYQPTNSNTDYLLIKSGETSYQAFLLAGYNIPLSRSQCVTIQADIGTNALDTSAFKIASSTDSGESRLRTGHNIGISKRIGWIQRDFMPYLLTGLRVSYFSGIQNSSILYKTSSLISPELGFGVNLAFRNTTGRIEYNYMFGRSIDVLTNDSNLVAVTYTPRLQSIQLSLLI